MIIFYLIVGVCNFIIDVGFIAAILILFRTLRANYLATRDHRLNEAKNRKFYDDCVIFCGYLVTILLIVDSSV